MVATSRSRKNAVSTYKLLSLFPIRLRTTLNASVVFTSTTRISSCSHRVLLQSHYAALLQAEAFVQWLLVLGVTVSNDITLGSCDNCMTF